ncbi:MAG: hypothetical protein KDJ26_05400 [Alphaproteobacteria bacterium]|nr:hypothetical protein [Alphaproteobacteria bacterium]MCB1551420.1 hypothetical protein [Alphaproteobacteria bacterium]MCB9985436.1 hypothetical protein [Micavibrio sp.]HRK98551.1 hypothetical protein [Alphaproteobacteria bacterium]
MGNKFFVIGLCFLALSLCSCGNEKENDARLARGCEAAAKTMLDKEEYDRQIDRVASKKLGMSDGFRLVTIDVVTKNKEFGYESNESFNCKFEEQSSFAGMMWRASLVQIQIDEDVYGSNGGKIFGDLNDQMKLMDAVQAAMK